MATVTSGPSGYQPPTLTTPGQSRPRDGLASSPPPGPGAIRLRAGVHLAYQPIGQVVLDERTGLFHRLNQLGSESLLALTVGGRPRATLHLCHRYPTLARGQAAGDIELFLHLLATQDLIEPSPDPATTYGDHREHPRVRVY